ncbi:flagellar filament capping protein FliD [Clostridium tertium]|uniref:Flagellar hook-associated protein 2 n=1 Tax=Clostridium tertium TaxID=1559 RepID=A0A6N3ELQ0_9CLOT
MRITGLATGLDMDQIVKDSMKPYRIKIDKKGQEKEILEIRQKLYREVIKDSREFYNKYFDVASSNSLLLSKNWSSVQFTSSNENILTASGSGDAKVDNYTITGKVAKASKIVLGSDEIKDNKVVINGKEFELKGSTEKEKATNLNNELKAAGINVSVKYTDFAGDNAANKSGFIFESTVLGKDNNFTIGGSFSDNKGTVVKGIDATASTIIKEDGNNFTIQDLKDASGKIKIGEKEIELVISDTLVPSDVEKLLQDKLKDYKLTAEVSESGEITFKTTELGSKVEDPKISINGVGGKFINGEDATNTKNTINISDIAGQKISINDNLVDLTGKNSPTEVVDHLNRIFKEQGLGFSASVNADDSIVLTSIIAGSSKEINLRVAGEGVKLSEGGDYSEIVIRNSKGGVYTHSGLTNSVTLDGVTFKFTGDIPAEGISVNGKSNVTELKDNLVNFFNDYNKLIEKLNTLTTEKRNRDFSPLTADQKKEMSEDEIKLWNEKVEKGQLSRDTDVTRISNSLKQAMRTLVDGTGLNLEKIGIKPVADYSGTKNGTFTIDEDKLTKALEENVQEVMDMFIKSPSKDDTLSEGEKYSRTGLMYRLKDVLYNETVTINSSLIKKAGIEGSSSAYNNEITKSIEKYEQKMKDMETDFARREQALYSKYAKLETIMNKYNSQQSYLMQQLGMS